MVDNLLEGLIATILEDGRKIAATGNDADANFMQGPRRACRDLERIYGTALVDPVLSALQNYNDDNLALAPLLTTVVRNIATKQSAFEDLVKDFHPEGLSAKQRANPQQPRPKEFQIAIQVASTIEIEYDPRILDLMKRSLQSSFPVVVSAALRACEAMGTPELAEACFATFENASGQTKAMALFSAAQLSHLYSGKRTNIVELAYSKDASIEIRLAAFEAFLTDLPNEEAQGLLQSKDGGLTTVLAEKPEFLAGLLDMANDPATQRAVSVLQEMSLVDVPDPLLRRVARSPFVSDGLRQAAIARVARQQTLDVSRAMSLSGAALHRDGSITSIYAGHAGLSTDSNGSSIIDCTTGRDPNAVKAITISDFKDGKSCWGYRFDNPAVANLTAVVRRAKEIASWRTRYDGNHLNQKGDWFTPNGGGPQYWEADCVGFTEHCYEHAGGNPTDNSYESGKGWPLSVREQRDAMNKVRNC